MRTVNLEIRRAFIMICKIEQNILKNLKKHPQALRCITIVLNYSNFYQHP